MKQRTAFTLLELLVVIAITALLLAVLLPALSGAREQSHVAVCLSRCRSLGTAMQSYYGAAGNLPWFYIHETDGEQLRPYPGASGFSSFSWGGMLPPSSPGTVDAQVTPAELRPLNRWVAPQARWTDAIDAYICPSDSSAANPGIESGGASAGTDTTVSNWRVFGTSYSINWHWVRRRIVDADRGAPQYLLHLLYSAGPTMLRDADPSRFVWGSENHLDQLMVAAKDDGAGVRAAGWHGKWSRHSAMYLDGHATNGEMDTRFLSGAAWTFSP